MPFQKGLSGNPAGRPPSGQAYTEILRKSGNKTLDYQGRRIARKRLLAEYLWQLVTTRSVTFPDGETIKAEPEEWLEQVWKLLERVDGLPPQSLDVTSAGEKLAPNIIEVRPIDYRAAIAPLAPGPMGDSEAPGESETAFDGEAVG